MGDATLVRRVLDVHTSLVGRRTELQRITAALRSASAGTPSVLWIEAFTGMGKTALLEAAATAALECGFQIGRAAASPLEQRTPFAVVRQLLETMHYELPAGDASSAARYGHDVITGAFTDMASGGFEEMLFRKAVHGIRQITAHLTQRAPLCLIIDDLQWVDVPSLHWLNHFVQRVAKLPVAVLMSRTSGVHGGDPLLLAELGAHSEQLKLEGLSEQDIAHLTEPVLGRTPDDELTAALRSATGGIPLVLRHLLAPTRERSASTDEVTASQLTSSGLEELGWAVLARLNRQSHDLVRFARAVAVVAPPSIELAAAITDLELPAAADHVRQLEGMGFLAPGGRLVFVRSIIRDAITSVVRHTDRDELHARAAQHLHGTWADNTSIARHVHQTACRLGVWAAEALRAAAGTLIAEGDLRTAATYFTRALREYLPDGLRSDLLLQLGLVEMYFDPRMAAIHLEEGMSGLEDPETIGDAACRLAQVLYLAGSYGKAEKVLNQAIEKIGSRQQRITDLLRLVLRVTLPSTVRRAEPVDLRHFDENNWRGGSARSLTLAALRTEHAQNQGKDLFLTKEAAFAAMSKGAAAIAEHPQRLIAVINALVHTDELDRALRYCDEIVSEVDRSGVSLIGLLGHVLRSQVHFHRGSLRDALADARHGMSLARSLSLPQHHLGLVYAVEAEVRSLLHLGETNAARDALRVFGMSKALPDSWHHTVLLHTRGLLRMADGDIEGALADQIECGDRLEAWGIRNPAILPWRSCGALARFQLGQRPQALDLALEELKLAREWGAATTVGRALLTVGKVTDGVAAIPWLTEAGSVLGKSPSQLLRASVQQELGATRGKLGQHEVARQHLATAKELAEQCGAASELRTLAEWRDETAGPFTATPSVRREVPSPLSPHEYRVAMLVVAGNSNDEIAQKLRVSRRAIEFHLTNIYRKLGVRRRMQLSSALQALSE
ncbi:AAA family ATPase [Lentzea sp. NPDC004782]|uniref:helix-turn-helix transcriptional regulator n=1 Tax=Lentzea sp. NPDC004782 TaxID=3154458 RepID=UPI0033B31388